jgi:hypothetical protein
MPSMNRAGTAGRPSLLKDTATLLVPERDVGVALFPVWPGLGQLQYRANRASEIASFCTKNYPNIAILKC